MVVGACPRTSAVVMTMSASAVSAVYICCGQPLLLLRERAGVPVGADRLLCGFGLHERRAHRLDLLADLGPDVERADAGTHAARGPDRREPGHARRR